jgi:hypothetical protein
MSKAGDQNLKQSILNSTWKRRDASRNRALTLQAASVCIVAVLVLFILLTITDSWFPVPKTLFGG